MSEFGRVDPREERGVEGRSGVSPDVVDRELEGLEEGSAPKIDPKVVAREQFDKIYEPSSFGADPLTDFRENFEPHEPPVGVERLTIKTAPEFDADTSLKSFLDHQITDDLGGAGFEPIDIHALPVFDPATGLSPQLEFLHSMLTDTNLNFSQPELAAVQKFADNLAEKQMARLGGDDPRAEGFVQQYKELYNLAALRTANKIAEADLKSMHERNQQHARENKIHRREFEDRSEGMHVEARQVDKAETAARGEDLEKDARDTKDRG